MANQLSEDEEPLNPTQARLVAKVRWMMVISGAATLLGVAVIIGVIGYRVFKAEGSVAPPDLIAFLPKGSKIVSTGVAENRIMVTVEVQGVMEIRTFDLRSLKATGRLKFATEP